MSAAGAAYLAPVTGFNSAKDAAALVRCVAAEDDEGIGAVANGNDHPRCLAVMLAVITVKVCRRGGLDNAGINTLLAEVSAEVSDYLLDQQTPVRGGDSSDARGL